MQANLAGAYCSLERWSDAEKWARKTVNARPDLPQVQMVIAFALVGQDRLEDARLAVEAARRARPDLSLAVVRHLLGHTPPEYLEPRIDALRKAGMPE